MENEQATNTQTTTQTTPTSLDWARAAAGFVVICLGVVLAMWVVLSVVDILTAETPPGIVAVITPAIEHAATVSIPPDTVIELPREAFTVLGYLVLCFLMTLCASIATAMIKSGAGLMHPALAETRKSIQRTKSQQS